MSGPNTRTTDKYVKIKREGDKAPENEIRIRADSRIGRSIAYAATLLLEKKFKTITIKASGAATKGACQVAEILRHKILGLHQVIQLKTNSVIDEYEPQEEGLDRVKVERKLAVLEITISLDVSTLDTKAPGYQAPLPKDQVSEEDLKTLVLGKRAQRTEGGEREEREFRGERREGRGEGRPFRRGRFAGGRGGRGRGFGRGGYREGGYREGGYREGGYREGGNREGGYREGGNREGGYREGGYRDREGGNREGGYREGGNREGGNREGGYREGGNREGGYREGGNREGGYREGGNREGGFRGRGRGFRGGSRGGFRGGRRD